ncbi:glycosyltransferase family 39 protein [Burkholderia pseudomultivorans]|uniref:glycosyltransferase family 39 protein n=1 Tax=Burkholderia pseudomultivorans TaxID=1207504 RepID=UPI000AE3086B|nr:glycosyltransferase family 39 protein [Burkholderia pseudomultivorans]
MNLRTVIARFRFRFHSILMAQITTREPLPLLALLPINAVVWTVAAWLSRGNLDMQGDMIENYAWGIEWQAGYFKHPPLFAWVTAAWFRIFPNTDLAYFALSSFNVLIGLLGIVALAGQFVPRRTAVVAGLAMAVSPLYSTLAVKFNANAILLSLWPWTAYFFVRFMQTGRRRFALALGVFGALSLLGKYFSVVLLTALLTAALARPAWRARLWSWPALVAVAAGAVVLGPHIAWLVTDRFETFSYAEDRMGGARWAAVERFGIYTLAQIAYLCLSFGFVGLLAGRSRWRAMKTMIGGSARPKRCPDLWWLTFGPLIVTGGVAVATGTQMASVWGMAAWFAIVPMWLVVLRRAQITVEPERARRLMAAYWAIVLVATAAVGFNAAFRGTDDAAEPRKELAMAARLLWRTTVGGEIPVVTGSVHEAQSILFYGNRRTRYWDMERPRTTPWLTADEVRRQGVLLVCRVGDTACVERSAAFSRAVPNYVEVSKRAWGRVMAARGYVVFVLRPAEQVVRR